MVGSIAGRGDHAAGGCRSRKRRSRGQGTRSRPRSRPGRPWSGSWRRSRPQPSRSRCHTCASGRARDNWKQRCCTRAAETGPEPSAMGMEGHSQAGQHIRWRSQLPEAQDTASIAAHHHQCSLHERALAAQTDLIACWMCTGEAGAREAAGGCCGGSGGCRGCRR